MTENFQNKQVFINDIPNLNHIEFKAIPRSYRLKSIIERSFSGALPLIAILIVDLAGLYDIDTIILILAVTGYLCLIFWPSLSVPRMFFAIRERDIIYKHGVLWQSKMTVPFSRIQHVDINQGPLDRKFKLGNLKVYTAGGSSGDLEINGLEISDAEKIKQFIVEKIRDND
ncbi:MAG: PH domain-containing protein [Calditrichaeota bacterium]|nr:PH domain-containing protein [Calditrichota bacterium]